VKLFVLLVGVVIAVSYPFLVHYSMERISPAVVAGVLFAIALGKLLISRLAGNKDAATNPYIPFLLVGIIAPLIIIFTKNNKVLMHIPTIVNAALFGVFFTSLYKGPAIIEKFARRDYPQMQQNAVDYCIVVTRVWSAVFLLNAAACFVLAEFAPRKYWLFWTSIGLWVFFGLVFAVEFIIRKQREGSFQEAAAEARKLKDQDEQKNVNCI